MYNYRKIQAKLRKFDYQSIELHSYLCSIAGISLESMTSRDQIIEILRTFTNENAEKYGIESMSLFGSVARGEHNENSDVDLLIKFKSPSLYLYAELADALETILGRKVDIVSESARKRPGFYKEISKDLIAL